MSFGRIDQRPLKPLFKIIHAARSSMGRPGVMSDTGISRHNPDGG
jgi:hypothetical protein